MAVTEVVKIIPDAVKISIFKAKKLDNHELGKGIEQNLLNSMAKEYLENVFKSYLTRDDLIVSDLACSTDWGKSSDDTEMSYFFIEGRFVNFPIDGRVLSGRLITTLSVRKNIKAKQFSIYPDDQNERIILLVDDLLSSELRDSMVINYINQNYGRPIEIAIKKERLEVFPNDIYCYVSVVLNNYSIKFLRIVFKIEEVVDLLFDKISIKKTSWSLKRADELFSCDFPEEDQIKEDTKENLYNYFENMYKKTNGKVISFKLTSGIKGFSKTTELVETNEEVIKLKIEFTYNFGKLLNFTNYLTTAYIKYKYNPQDNKFGYIDIEILDAKVV
jgi:hypothetical protein